MQPEFRSHRHLHRHGFDPRSGSPPDWLSVILASSTEEEVAATARDYLASWTPEELHRLPKDCQPGRIRDGEDINTFAFQLTRARFERAADVDENLLEKMMVFFTHATTRVGQLQAEKPGPSGLEDYPFG